ncbi:MAG: heterocyst development glycosyltransferase HepC [Rivularia sp. (in: cyanobacteria)]|jgi:lipopolysaccharide/colanic/teichoic acid biosynthesis glycosyltransferase
MKTDLLPTVNNSSNVSEPNSSTYCTLQWRRNQLLVKPIGSVKQPCMPLLDTYESLKECLQHSSVNLVRIDPKLGEEKVKLWADAAAWASKPIYLQIATDRKQSKPNSYFLSWIKRFCFGAIAMLVLLVASPLMLLLAALMKIDAQAPIFERSWYVGERGRLFKLIKFSTASVNQKEQATTQLRKLMCKYGLNNLPQLLNVIRGEMGLFGSRCWTLEDAVRLTPRSHKQLNNLPGIMNSWEVETEESSILHLDSQTS